MMMMMMVIAQGIRKGVRNESTKTPCMYCQIKCMPGDLQKDLGNHFLPTNLATLRTTAFILGDKSV